MNIAEIKVDGKLVFAATKMPVVVESGGAICIRCGNGTVVRLCPDLASKVSDVFSAWQYEKYG